MSGPVAVIGALIVLVGTLFLFLGGLGLFRMRFIPSADFGALEAAYQDVSVEAVLVARAWIDVGPLRLSLRVGGIAGLRAASAVDETMRVVSTYGVGGELALGLGLRF